MIITRDFKIINDISKSIGGYIKQPEQSSGKLPAVIILHGFKGFSRWGFFPWLSEYIASRGAISICFDFSMNGSPDSSGVLASVEDFADNTVSRELSDMSDLFGSLNEIFSEAERNLWNGRVFLVGHSMGAAVALLCAKDRDDIAGLALLAPIAKFDRYSERQKKIWKKMGYFEFPNIRTGQTLRLNTVFLNDLEQNFEKYSLTNAAKECKLPLLIVHGTEDKTVPLSEPEALFEAAAENAKKYYIRQTGHTFGVEHPMEEAPPALIKAAKIITDFFGLNNE